MNNKGYKSRPESFYQPARLEKREGNVNGSSHDFNTKGKITSTSESCYHNPSAGSGSYGNFAEKDAQLAYLTERGKKGAVIKQFTGGQEHSRMHTSNIGPTAYNSRPIDEVYKPATSQHVPPAEAVVYNTKKKDR